MRPNSALDRRTFLNCLFLDSTEKSLNMMKFVSERSEEIEEQKKNKGGVLVAESSYISQKAQFDLVRKTVIFNSNYLCFRARGARVWAPTTRDELQAVQTFLLKKYTSQNTNGTLYNQSLNGTWMSYTAR